MNVLAIIWPGLAILVLGYVDWWIGFWMTVDRSKGPCDVFDPWVRWERGQVGI